MKKLIVFISVIVLFFSCNKVHYYYIPEDEKPLLVNNDTICFLDSANNRIDTTCVNILHYYDASEELAYEIIEVHYNILNKHASIKYLDISQSVIVSVISINYHYFAINTPIIKNNLSIHGIIYPKVYVFQEFGFPDSIPSTVYYTFQHGIIRYDYSKSRHYEIINN